MCRIVVTNQLYLGNRMLGFEAYSLPKGEVVEFTEKQLKDMIKQGKSKVFGMKLDMSTGNLIMDIEGFFVRNMMKKIHIRLSGGKVGISRTHPRGRKHRRGGFHNNTP